MLTGFCIDWPYDTHHHVYPYRHTERCFLYDHDRNMTPILDKNKWSNNKRSSEYHETIWIFDMVYLDTHASKCCNKNFLRANEWMKIIYLRHINILICIKLYRKCHITSYKRINSTITNINLISRILYKFHWDLIISYHVCSSWSCQFLLWCMCDNEWEVKLSYAIVNKGTHIYCIDYWLNVWTISIPLHHIEFWIGF